VLVRGGDNRSGELFSYVDLEARVRRDHPLRPIRIIAVRISMMAGSKTLRSKGRIQMCEISNLQISQIQLERTAGPYRRANY
jgi:hypothetical protein